MKNVINRHTIEDRLANFAADNYVHIYGILKNVAFGLAAIVPITFFKDSETLWAKFSLWIASLSIITMTHTTAARGVLLIGFKYNRFDVLIPFAMGILECLLFSVLQGSIEPQLWQYWYYLACFHSLLAILLVTNRRALTLINEFSDELTPLAVVLRNWLKGDITGACVCCILEFVLGVLNNLWNDLNWSGIRYGQIGAGLLVTGVMYKVIAKAEEERNYISVFIANLPLEADASLKENINHMSRMVPERISIRKAIKNRLLK